MPAETRRLAVITAWLLVLTLMHDVDHLRQGRSLPAVLYLVAAFAVISLVATLTVQVRWPQWARPVAVAQGLATVAGVGAVHAGPQWSRFVDSYSAARADALSWAIIIAMMASGAVLAAVATVAGGVAEAGTG